MRSTLFYDPSPLSQLVFFSPAPPKKDKVKTRAHQKAFLASLQATPAVLKKNNETRARFDNDDGRLAWLQREKYIKADSIAPSSVICGGCSLTQILKPKTNKRKCTRKRNCAYTPTAWIAHRQNCPFIYKKWLQEKGLTDSGRNVVIPWLSYFVG